MINKALRALKSFFSLYGVTAATLFSGLAIVGLGIFFTMYGGVQTSQYSNTMVFADGAMCNELCSPGNEGEICGGGSGICANETVENGGVCEYTGTCLFNQNENDCTNSGGGCYREDLGAGGGSCLPINDICPGSDESTCVNEGDCTWTPTFEEQLTCNCDNEALSCGDTCTVEGGPCNLGAGTCETVPTVSCQNILPDPCNQRDISECGFEVNGSCERFAAESLCQSAVICDDFNETTCGQYSLNCERVNQNNDQLLCSCTNSQCGEANNTEYYTQDPLRPDAAGQGALCTNGGPEGGLMGSRTRGCTNQLGCSATNLHCGDGVITASGGEQCDGVNLGTASCADQGYNVGDVSCTSGCQLDYSACSGAFYCDFDGDGFIPSTMNCNGSLSECEAQLPVGSAGCQETAGNDCFDLLYLDGQFQLQIQDANPEDVYPGAPVNCTNGMDNNCNGFIDSEEGICALGEEEGTISGLVFIDYDGDSNYNSENDGLFSGDITINLLDAGDATVASGSNVTEGGPYSFTGAYGNYTVWVIPPSGYEIVPQTGTGSFDNKILASNSTSSQITLDSENNAFNDIHIGLSEICADIGDAQININTTQPENVIVSFTQQSGFVYNGVSLTDDQSIIVQDQTIDDNVVNRNIADLTPGQYSYLLNYSCGGDMFSIPVQFTVEESGTGEQCNTQVEINNNLTVSELTANTGGSANPNGTATIAFETTPGNTYDNLLLEYQLNGESGWTPAGTPTINGTTHTRTIAQLDEGQYNYRLGFVCDGNSLSAENTFNILNDGGGTGGDQCNTQVEINNNLTVTELTENTGGSANPNGTATITFETTPGNTYDILILEYQQNGASGRTPVGNPSISGTTHTRTVTQLDGGAYNYRLSFVCDGNSLSATNTFTIINDGGGTGGDQCITESEINSNLSVTAITENTGGSANPDGTATVTFNTYPGFTYDNLQLEYQLNGASGWTPANAPTINGSVYTRTITQLDGGAYNFRLSFMCDEVPLESGGSFSITNDDGSSGEFCITQSETTENLSITEQTENTGGSANPNGTATIAFNTYLGYTYDNLQLEYQLNGASGWTPANAPTFNGSVYTRTITGLNGGQYNYRVSFLCDEIPISSQASFTITNDGGQSGELCLSQAQINNNVSVTQITNNTGGSANPNGSITITFNATQGYVYNNLQLEYQQNGQSGRLRAGNPSINGNVYTRTISQLNGAQYNYRVSFVCDGNSLLTQNSFTIVNDNGGTADLCMSQLQMNEALNVTNVTNNSGGSANPNGSATVTFAVIPGYTYDNLQLEYQQNGQLGWTFAGTPNFNGTTYTRSLTQLNGAQYNVRISFMCDGNTLTQQDSFTILNGCTAQLSPIISDESACLANDGSITPSLNQGGHSVAYSLIDANGNPVSASNGIFTGLAPGEYGLVAEYNDGGNSCTLRQDYTIEGFECIGCLLNDQPENILTIQTENPTSGSTQGSATVTHNLPAGFQMNQYTLQLQGQNNSDIFTPINNNPYQIPMGLAPLPSSYTLYGTYAADTGETCQTRTATINITPFQDGTCTGTVSANATSETACNESDGAVTISLMNGEGGTVTSVGLVGGGVTLSNQTGEFTGLEPGSYNIQLSYLHSNGTTECELFDTVTVEQAVCEFCEGTASVLIRQVSHETSCGLNDGSITAQLIGTTNSTNIQFRLLQGSNLLQSNQTGNFSNIAPGSYRVEVAYVNETDTQCSVITSESIVITSATCAGSCYDSSVSTTLTNESACNLNDGSVTATLNHEDFSGSIDVTYVLQEGGVTIATNNSGVFANLMPGTYTIVATYQGEDGTTFCPVTSSAFTIQEADCGGGGGDPLPCNVNHIINVTNESTCNAQDGTFMVTAPGTSEVPVSITLLRNQQPYEAQFQNNQFINLPPGSYRAQIAYDSCSFTTQSSATITAASCSQAECGPASDNDYSSSGSIPQNQLCAAGTAGSVTRSGSSWSWACTGSNTITCNAEISDTDGDGVLDPDDNCPNTPGPASNDGCPTNNNGGGGGRGFGGSVSSISPAICGNGILERGEQCDDGNRTDGDGCSGSCRLESDNETIPVTDSATPTTMIAGKLREAIQTIQTACFYDDVDYGSRLQRLKDISWRDRYDPSYVMTLYCITKGYKDKFHRTSPTGIGEAIKMIAKVHAIGSNTQFNEIGNYPGPHPFSDMTPTAWYTTYVLYAYNAGLLTGITDSHPIRTHLKAFTPISPMQFDLLVKNAGGINYAAGNNQALLQSDDDIDDLFNFLGFMQPVHTQTNSSSRYVSRQQAADIIIAMFPEKFKNYRYLVGNNLQFYQRLLRNIQQLTAQEQVAYVKNMISKLERSDQDMMGEKVQIDVPAIIDFLNEALEDL